MSGLKLPIEKFVIHELYCSAKGPRPKDAEENYDWFDHMLSQTKSGIETNVVCSAKAEKSPDEHSGFPVTISVTRPMLCGVCLAPIHRRIV